MLQQTPVSRVLPIWREWLKRWPTPEELANASRSELLREWGRLGYPRRALRLHECAVIISRDFKNQVPNSLVSLRSLPGVGEYTAAAIMAFAFNEPALVLDTNIRRLFARLIDGVQYPTATPSKLERELRMTLIPTDGAKWAAATMEFGALLCTSQKPKCDVCPLRQECAWRAAGYPKSEWVRKSQSWDGTDRQCRGTILQALRENEKLSTSALKKLWRESSQVERALNTLIADGLIETTGKSYRLPS